MADYTQSIDFSAKDALATGDANKIAKGADIDTELGLISDSLASKVDESREGVALGVATLDAGTLIPVAQLPAATTTAVGVLEIATDAEAITATATDKWLTPANLKAVQDQNAAILTDLIALADPGADRILFWDDGTNEAAFLTVSTGLTLSGTNLTSNDSAIVHDNLSGFVADEHVAHSGISVIAGEGLAGGGTIDGNVTINMDITELTNITAATIVGGDELAIDVSGTTKALAWQDFGVPTSTDATTTPFSALALSDANRMVICTNAGAITATLPANAAVAFPIGTTFALYQQGAGQITVGITTDTLRAPNGTKTAAQYSVIFLTKTTATEWVLTGNATT